MHSGITKVRKTVGQVFPKPLWVEGTSQKLFSSKLFFIIVHIAAASSEEYRCTHVDACVWQELEYRINVCPVTHGAHIKHL
jgi:hypothetical protein